MRRAPRIVLSAAVQIEVSLGQWLHDFDPPAGLDERHPASLAGAASVGAAGGALETVLPDNWTLDTRCISLFFSSPVCRS